MGYHFSLLYLVYVFECPGLFFVLVPAFWGSWGQWSACSASCGNGVRSRTHECVGGNPGDKDCVPASDAMLQEQCNIGPCLPGKLHIQLLSIGV